MKEKIFPTSEDIYLEINGRKLAVVEGYKVITKKNIRVIRAFGHRDPVGMVEGENSHEIILSRVYFSNNIETQEDIFGLKNFNLVIIKPDKRIIYTGCNWSEILEDGEIGDVIKENIMIFSKNRAEII